MAAHNHTSAKLTFANSRGHRLAAILDMPRDATPTATALFCHCFACSKDMKAAARVSRALAERGIAVLRFDFTGLGESEGAFEDSHFSANMADVRDAADYLAGTYGAPSLLIGHSFGGAAVLGAAADIASARAVVTIGAPSGPAHVKHLFRDHLEIIHAEGAAEIEIGGRCFRVTRDFVRDIDAHELKERIGRMRKALLILHAPLDQTVGIENAADIFAAAKHPKSFVSLDDADHLLTRGRDADYVAEVVAAWAGRYLGLDRPAQTPAPSAEAPLDDGFVHVEEIGPGPYANRVRIGRHEMRADEPLSVPGGTDAGPGPYDYLLAGLGACTAMTIRMYAEHKGFAVERVGVRLKHSKVHAEDCADCEGRDGKIDVIEREIEVTGDLDAKTRERLLLVADKCPVHKTLHSEIVVRTKLAAADQPK